MVEHLLHLLGHLVGRSVLLLVEVKLTCGHTLAVLFVLKEVAAEHTVNVFEVLEDLEAGTLVF